MTGSAWGALRALRVLVRSRTGWRQTGPHAMKRRGQKTWWTGERLIIGARQLMREGLSTAQESTMAPRKG